MVSSHKASRDPYSCSNQKMFELLPCSFFQEFEDEIPLYLGTFSSLIYLIGLFEDVIQFSKLMNSHLRKDLPGSEQRHALHSRCILASRSNFGAHHSKLSINTCTKFHLFLEPREPERRTDLYFSHSPCRGVPLTCLCNSFVSSRLLL